MKNVKLKIEFDGTNYSGWQRQKNAITIQEVMEETISKLTCEKTIIYGVSRTDSGVHAKEFVANFHTGSSIPADRFSYALNTHLPKDIRVLSSTEVPEDFHSRYNAKGKSYSYSILNRRQEPALFANYMHHIKRPLDIELMKEGGKYILGTHDFKCFKSLGGNTRNDVRTVFDIYFTKEENMIKIFIKGDGFLYNMVRIISGTLVNVGLKNIEPQEIINIIASKKRNRASICLPAKGLCLEKVWY